MISRLGWCFDLMVLLRDSGRQQAITGVLFLKHFANLLGQFAEHVEGEDLEGATSRINGLARRRGS
jgi:hypothetical protein